MGNRAHVGSHHLDAANIEGCPVEMFVRPRFAIRGLPCGRPIYHAPLAADEKPVCLMHSRDPEKNEQDFWKEYERLLQDVCEDVADFSGFVFTGPMHETVFVKPCSFQRAIFLNDVDFWAANFQHNVDFWGATFNGNVSFNMGSFGGVANFTDVRFAGAVEFKMAHFQWDNSASTVNFGLIFTGVRCEKPEKVTFYQVNLSNAVFHNCDVSKFDFSDVTWRRRSNGKQMVYDEVISLDYVYNVDSDLNPLKGVVVGRALDSRGSDPRNYRLIAELYQQLKKNYDERRDYTTAGDFHYGEMEMKRLTSSRRNRALRWLHINLGLAAWYKYASDYGESYVKPWSWLLLVVFVFMLLYPLVGLQLDRSRSNPSVASQPIGAIEARPKLTYWHPLQGSSDTHSPRQARLALIGHSLLATLYIAAFQKDLTYQPSYPWGHLLALVETLLTSTVGGLFLLAVRRQFKR